MRRSIAATTVLVLLSAAFAAPSSASTRSCARHYEDRREIAHGRFEDRRWELYFYRDGRGRPCLADSWRIYGSIFPFRVREHRPTLGILNLAATTPPKARGTVYVMDGYVSPRVARLTFRLDGRTEVIDIIRAPDWTRLRKDLFVHLVAGDRYDRDATGRLRAFDGTGNFLSQKLLRRRDFSETVKVDG